MVDDESSDGTAEVARRLGARVIAAGESPPGWVGKPWALQRGLEAAGGEVVMSVDADTRPRPGLARALAEALQESDFVCAAARFRCDTAGEQWLHPAMLATLVYRFGPPDSCAPAKVNRLVVTGQCVAVRRQQLLDAGGYVHSARHLTDDAAQARALAARGWRIAFYDGDGLIAVDMHDSLAEVWREWGRSIALRDVTSPAWLLADVVVVWLTLGLPTLRLLIRRANRLDAGLVALRWIMSVPLAGSYEHRRLTLWLSPLADPLAALRLTLSALRPAREWRGRLYLDGAGTGRR